MSELYWITRLDSANDILIAIIILTVISSISTMVCLMASLEDNDTETAHSASKYLKIEVIVMIITIIVRAFIPTTKEACAIYGIGTTLDYIQESKEIKQLPDKAVKCINLFLDEYIEEEQSNKE